MSQIHHTGRTPSALVAQLLRKMYQLNLTVGKELEEKRALEDVHELEKTNLLELMFTINKNCASTASIQCSTDTSSTASIQSSTETSSVECSTKTSSTPSDEVSTGTNIQSSQTQLTVDAPKIRDKVIYFCWYFYYETKSSVFTLELNVLVLLTEPETSVAVSGL